MVDASVWIRMTWPTVAFMRGVVDGGVLRSATDAAFEWLDVDAINIYPQKGGRCR